MFVVRCFIALQIGVSDLHHGGGAVSAVVADAVGAAQAGVTGKDVGATVFSAKHCPFGEHCQTVQCCRTCTAYGGIGKDAIVEGHIDAVMGAVKSNRLHINIGLQQLGTAHLRASGIVQHGLRTSG